MAEVTVDATPKPHAPYDPDSIPEAVKKRVAAVEAMYTQNGSPESGTSSTPAAPTETPEPASLQVEAPQPPQTQDTSPPVPPAPAVPSSPPPPADDNSETWKSRYMGLQGRFTASQKTIGEMQEQMVQLGNELLHLQRMPPQTNQQPPPPPAPAYLTEQDVQNYGNELIDVTQRAAMHALAPELQEIKRQNAELQQRLSKEARRSLDQAVELAVPDYRDIDRNPRWHSWLLGIDILSGKVRQALLNEAISSASAPRVISFFKGFKHEEAATGHSELAPSSKVTTSPREPALDLSSIATPGRARPATGGDASLPPEKPIYTRAQIAQLYSLKRKNMFVGREAEWARQEADIFAAQHEGRIRS